MTILHQVQLPVDAKRGKNCSINHNENDTITPEVQFSNATSEIINNQGHNFEENKWLSLRPCWETPLSEGSTSQQENHKEVCNVYNLEDHGTPIHQHMESCDYGFICSV
ncbi:uncharacterized protein LOC129315362 isoform X2 [Prosopis cineraria]|uniref:uncharacterized protein LOC129315362 isoform X2 n=1 Tax=Prosopis cineraria TaxID=364024 RepID=UPI00240F8025|nr:uncharacterized protein LOC129315362 isoform X2 [Prosopis cineraria]